MLKCFTNTISGYKFLFCRSLFLRTCIYLSKIFLWILTSRSKLISPKQRVLSGRAAAPGWGASAKSSGNRAKQQYSTAETNGASENVLFGKRVLSFFPTFLYLPSNYYLSLNSIRPIIFRLNLTDIHHVFYIFNFPLFVRAAFLNSRSHRSGSAFTGEFELYLSFPPRQDFPFLL